MLLDLLQSEEIVSKIGNEAGHQGLLCILKPSKIETPRAEIVQKRSRGCCHRREENVACQYQAMVLSLGDHGGGSAILV